jgi:selenide,water dikinase
LDLQGLFSKLDFRRDPNLLVGVETNDDAAVYRLNDEQAVVLTADYITPFINDPYLYGAVAAANSLSDVYAMGGRPFAVLNLCMFPLAAGAETLTRVLQGGLDKTHEAGALLVGGHTVKDEEMKYGLSVTGLVNPRHYTPNSGARLGDAFILTKPVGSGVCITGARKGVLPEPELLPVARKMAELNRTACETMMEFDARGATDITGFGLAGHTLSMAKASKLGIRFFYEAVPRFPRSLELLDAGMMTGLTAPNFKLVEQGIEFKGAFAEAEKGLFWDPQTSGGLFFGIQARDASACLKKLHERGVADARIVAESFMTDVPHLEIVRT